MATAESTTVLERAEAVEAAAEAAEVQATTEVVVSQEPDAQDDASYYVVVEDGAAGQEHQGPSTEEAGEGEGVEYVTVDGEVCLTEAQLKALEAAGQTLQIVQDGEQQILAQAEDGSFNLVQLVPDGEEAPDGSVAQGPKAHDGSATSVRMSEPIPQGMKLRRHRVHGHCRCPECGQTFINSARLERHLAVHQVFGSYLCPLCGKTFKYEYNLFYHWRRSCRDLNELMPVEERKSMDINALRTLVDEVAAKKAEMGTLDPGMRRVKPPEPGPAPPRTELPEARRGEPCPQCGVVVLASHLERHLEIHRGDTAVDSPSVGGGFYCDLCGLMFRQHFNLMKHWRASCPEIQYHLGPRRDLTMDDEQLKLLVQSIIQKPREQEAQVVVAAEGGVAEEDTGLRVIRVQAVEGPAHPADAAPELLPEEAQEASGQEADTTARANVREAGAEVGGEASRKGDAEIDVEGVVEAEETEVVVEGEEGGWPALEAAAGQHGQLMEEQFVFAEDGTVYQVAGEEEEVGPLGLRTTQSRAKWSMVGGPVRCPECFRSFANAGRLERHLAGFHASYGTHHCSLCGNRFKYDYNLLYHYRRSCPYTKAFIDRDVREQMDAPSLRKLVRNLAQKEVRLTPQVEPPARLPGREPPKPRLANRYQGTAPPGHLLNPASKNGQPLPEGKTCPVCGLIFYGLAAIRSHMGNKHPAEWEEWLRLGGPEAVDIQYTDEHGNQIHIQDQPDDPNEQLVLQEGGVQYLAEMPGDAEGGSGEGSSRTLVLETMEGAGAAVRTTRAGAKRAGPSAAEAPTTKRPRGEVDQELESSVATFLSEVASSKSKAPAEVAGRRTRSGSGRGEAEAADETLDVTGDQQPEPPMMRTVTVALKSESSARKSPRQAAAASALGVPCPDCPRRFATNAHLTKHRKSHLPQEEEQTCELCELRFRENSSLVTHWRTGSCGRLRTAVPGGRKVLGSLDEAALRQIVRSVLDNCEIVVETEMDEEGPAPPPADSPASPPPTSPPPTRAKRAAAKSHSTPTVKTAAVPTLKTATLTKAQPVPKTMVAKAKAASPAPALPTRRSARRKQMMQDDDVE